LTADGKMRACLFSHKEYDLLAKAREGASDNELIDFIRHGIWQKQAGHSIHLPGFEPPTRSMSRIGG